MTSQAFSSSNESSPHRQGKTVEQLRHELTVALDRMTALDLADLKNDFDTASTQKPGLIADYAAKYKGLRDRWWAEHLLVAKLYQTLTCTFEDDEWKTIARGCVCELRGVVAEWNRIIRSKNDCSKGDLERAVARAQSARDHVKARRDSWMGAAAALDAQLTANDALVKTIQTLASEPDQQTQAIYQFWFVLLPAHRQIMPDDAPPAAQELGQGESPEEICELSETPARVPPWLVEPHKYGHVLDAIWDEYYEAQTAYAQAAAAFHEKPDDLATITQTCATLTASLVADIAACLTKCAPQSPCNGSTSTSEGD